MKYHASHVVVNKLVSDIKFSRIVSLGPHSINRPICNKADPGIQK